MCLLSGITQASTFFIFFLFFCFCTSHLFFVSGADAKPFETYHNALGLDLTLRIATELHLKRLVRLDGLPACLHVC